jgi:apolipoprotein N-acyltransferase
MDVSANSLPAAIVADNTFRYPLWFMKAFLRQFAVASASMLLLALAFPRPGWYPLAHIALVPIALLALRATSVRRMMLATWLAGFLWWLVMLRWMAPVTVGGYVALGVYLALYVALPLGAFRVLVRRWHWPALIALPAAWVAGEFVRNHFPAGGAPWLGLGHTQAPWLLGQSASRLIQVADIAGDYAVSFVVAASSGVIVDLLTHPLVAIAADGTRSRRPALMIYGTWLLIIVTAMVYGQHRLNQSFASSRSLRIAVVQTNVPQDNKDSPDPEQIEGDWRAMIDLVRQAAAMEPKPQLIVTPETMAPGALNIEARRYYRTAPTAELGSERYHDTLDALADELDVALLIGAHAKFDWVEVRQPGDDRVFLIPRIRYNAAFLFEPGNDREPRRYDKVHRVPFGEYIPWVDHFPAVKQWFIKTISPYDFDYSLAAGDSFVVFEQNGVRFAAPICFEDTIGRVVRQMVWDDHTTGGTSGGASGGGKRADMLINLTNDGWFMGTNQPVQHFQIAALRCVENRVPMARSVNTGVSGFIDSTGRVVEQVRVYNHVQDVAGVASYELVADPRTPLFAKLGRWPAGLLTLVVIGLTAVGLFNAKRQMSIRAAQSKNAG